MGEVVSELEPFFELELPDDWVLSPATRELGGPAIQLELEYTRRPDVTFANHTADGFETEWYNVSTTISLWWYAADNEYVIEGPAMVEHCTADAETAEHKLREAMGVTRSHAERRWIGLACRNVDGIGPVTVQRLHEEYGQLERILDASPTRLKTIPNVTGDAISEVRRQFKLNGDDQEQLTEWASS
ncbi:helix-hairpin-helix domain-containing protein [Salinibaculum rarum]|uniref:helix-hairpin-helix domain-containing protein n=1 Tax=Salinibaculum rarum TaxID=3058903 RepID=UPI00265D82AE|nr:helix-hairpin-helix domain-containing protein [Salinibaculum sp. KK48]